MKRLGMALAALAACAQPAAAAQLHVRESMPAAETVIHGDHAEYLIRFDALIDHAVSRLDIVQAGRVVETLVPTGDSAADVLFASGETPPAGRYQLHWHAASQDGEVSDGEIAFSVAP